MTDTNLDLRKLCQKMRIGSAVCDVYENIAFENKEQFLCDVLRTALDLRTAQARNRLRQQAGFDLIKTLEDFDFSELETPNGLSLESLKACEFIVNKQNLVLYGSPGTGKTHLATALGVEACRRGYSVLYFRVSHLVQELTAAHREGVRAPFWRKLKDCKLLVLDELGFLPFDQTGTRLLFEAVAECYEKRSVIVTTNLTFAEWNSTFGDAKLTGAIIDRIVHHGMLISHKGGSYRIRNSMIQ